MRSGPSSPFPFALYGSLVLALVVLWSRERFLGIEQRLRGIVVLPLRTYAAFSTEVQAKESRSASRPGGIALLGRELASRLARASAALPSAVRPVGCEPLVCRVAEQRRGAFERVPSSLVLDLDPAVAALCLPFVTYGEHLIGFLERVDDGARVGVALLHRTGEPTGSRQPSTGILRRLVAEFPADDSEGTRLRCLVEPARASEPWLLRCLALEDPYRAAGIVVGGAVVRTAIDSGREDAPPAGLVIGELRVRGFENHGRAVPIGLYVRPQMQPLGISTVTLWRRQDGGPIPELADAATALAKTHLVHPTRLLDLPAPPPTYEAWFLATQGGLRLARGAAVLSNGALVGVVQSSGSGYAVAVPFWAPARWSLLWMPEQHDAAPADLVGRSVAREGDLVTIEIEGDQPWLPGAATLWSGTMGAHCPAGLPIGEVVETDAVTRRIRVRLWGDLHGPFHALARRSSGP